MKREIVYIDKTTGIPLMGIDFLGIIDRGTNVIELKPLTLCNLQCKYCFVSAGDYHTNFIINSNYLVEQLEKVIQIKAFHDIEIHIAPYGESLLYEELFDLLKQVSRIEGISTISMQSNGLLLSEAIIKALKENNLTRINLSLNTLNEDLACYLCNCNQYDVETILKHIYLLLESGIDVLLAPVWFPGENDQDVKDIIRLVLKIRNEGYSDKQIQIGIQKYLTYKTGRKLKKIRPKTWDYFYLQLSKLEKEFHIKLKLGPNDFNIHKRKQVSPQIFKKGDVINIEIISKGRYEYECLGKITETRGIKILLKKPLIFTDTLVGKHFKAQIIKANFKDNIITASIPLKK